MAGVLEVLGSILSVLHKLDVLARAWNPSAQDLESRESGPPTHMMILGTCSTSGMWNMCGMCCYCWNCPGTYVHSDLYLVCQVIFSSPCSLLVALLTPHGMNGYYKSYSELQSHIAWINFYKRLAVS